MGNELLKRTNIPSAGLWSAQFLLDSPNLVEEVHQDYINAGAKVITTNTYSTIPSYLSKQNASHLMEELIIKAGSIAREVSNYDERKLDLDNRVKLLEELQSESSLKELKLLFFATHLPGSLYFQKPFGTLISSI